MVIIITAPPRMGKSTLIKKISANPSFAMASGFVTEEVVVFTLKSKEKERDGFKMINVTDETSELIASKVFPESRYKIGSYFVYPEKVSNMLSYVEMRDVMLVDEVGKMQNFSPELKNFIPKLVTKSKFVIITVTEDDSVNLAKELRENKEYLLIRLTESNRNWLDLILVHLKKRAYRYNEMSVAKKIAFNEVISKILGSEKVSTEKVLYAINYHLFFLG